MNKSTSGSGSVNESIRWNPYKYKVNLKFYN